MRRNTTRTTDPLDRGVDFERFGPVRRNAFSGSGQRSGPSLLALWEMPEIRPDAILLRRGHPGHGKRRTTVVRSIRLPAAVWKEIEDKAKAKHLNLHQAMRAALLGWVGRTGS
jgi:hypothetical protein